MQLKLTPTEVDTVRAALALYRDHCKAREVIYGEGGDKPAEKQYRDERDTALKVLVRLG